MAKKGNGSKLSSKSGHGAGYNKTKAKATSAGRNKKVNKSLGNKAQLKNSGNKTLKNNHNKRARDQDEEEEEDETATDDFKKESIKRKKMKETKKSLWSQIKSYVDATDVLLVVLDARDPQRCKSKRLERLVRQDAEKRIIYVLNKIDLVPRRNAEGWVKNLSQEYPTIATKAASTTSEQHPIVGIEELAGFLTHFASRTPKSSIHVGFAGYTSVGRSSLIKALKQSKELASQKEKIKLNETPATLPNMLNDINSGDDDDKDNNDDDDHQNRKGGFAGPIELLLRSKIIPSKDLVSITEWIVMRCKKQTLLVTYALPMFDDGNEFLCHLARQQGNVLKGNIPDTITAARSFLRDMTSIDKLPFYTTPPPSPSPPRGDSSSLTASLWIKEFGTSSKKVIQMLNSFLFPIDAKLALVLSPQELEEDQEEEDQQEKVEE